MRIFGMIGTLISLAVIGYLVMSRMKTTPMSQSGKLKSLQKEHGLELPAGAINDSLSDMPKTIKKDLEKKMRERTLSTNED
jgi:hypothetical protein